MSLGQTLLSEGVLSPSLSPGLGLKQQTTDTPEIKEEPEDPEEQSVKQEEEPLPVSVPESGGVCVKREESSLLQHRAEGEDISSEPQFHSEAEGHSSDTDNDVDWELSRCSPARSTGLFPKYKSAPETSAPVSEKDLSGAERKKHQCSVCFLTFGYKQLLKRHMRVHTGVKPYSCSHCEEAFCFKSELNVHTRTHARDKPYSCSHCEKTFCFQNDLLLHTRTHTGEKPYSCSLCEVAFACIRGLNAHMRTHMGASPYSCSLCKETFPLQIKLERHMKTHKKEEFYSCSFCAKAFIAKDELDSHIKTHRTDMAFSSLFCQMDLPDSTSLKEHLKAQAKPSSCSRSSQPERSTVTSEEELSGSKEKNPRKQQLLDSAVILMNLLHRAAPTVSSPSPGPGLNQEIPETPQIKEEPEEQSIHQEEEQLPVSVPESSAVCEKRDESSRLQQRQTEFPPETSASVNDGDLSGAEGADAKTHKRFKTKQQLQVLSRPRTGEKPFSCTGIVFNCSVCALDFSNLASFKNHLRTHQEAPSSSSRSQESQEERCGSREENPRKRQLLGSALSATVQLHRAGVQTPSLSPGPGLKQEIPEAPQIEDEVMEVIIKEEEEQLPVSVPESSAVCVKREEPSLLQQTEHRQETQREDGSESEGQTEHSSDTDDDGAGSSVYVEDTSGAEGKTSKTSAPTEVRPYVCAMCDQSFLQYAQLKKHMKTHTGERLYSCPICLKTFSQNASVQRHLRVHTGDQPYSCTFCEKSFARKFTLELHVRKHHTGERPYSCSLCNTSYADKYSLTRHMLYTRTHMATRAAAKTEENVMILLLPQNDVRTSGVEGPNSVAQSDT